MKKKMKKRSFVALLMSILMLASNMSVLAAEPVNTSTIDVDVSAPSEIESSGSVLSLTAPSGRILSKKAVSVNGSQMYEVTFATETGSDTVLLPRSIYGYAADYTDYKIGSFSVNAPGSSTTTGHATIKTSDFGSSTQVVLVSIYRPDGTLAKGNVRMTGNQEKVVSFTNAQPGNYNIAYSVDGNYKGWIHCWIY